MTDLEVINRALTLISVETIGALADQSKAARVMVALLPETKKIVLNEFPWSFAMRIAPLIPSASAPPAGYLKAFTYPADALSVYRVSGNRDTGNVAEFRVIGNVIAANITSGNVEYTAFVDALDLWPIQVGECLVNRLASDAATALTGSPQLAMTMLEKYMALARVASQTSVVEENVTPVRATDYIDSRK